MCFRLSTTLEVKSRTAWRSVCLDPLSRWLFMELLSAAVLSVSGWIAWIETPAHIRPGQGMSCHYVYISIHWTGVRAVCWILSCTHRTHSDRQTAYNNPAPIHGSSCKYIRCLVSWGTFFCQAGNLAQSHWEGPGHPILYVPPSVWEPHCARTTALQQI